MKTLEEIKNTCENWEDVEPRWRLYVIRLDCENVSEFNSQRTSAEYMRERLKEIIGADKGDDYAYKVDKSGAWGVVAWGGENGHVLEIEAV